MNPYAPPPPPPPCLSTTLSSLTNLLSLAATALPFSPPNLNTNFIQCPFNHHHLLPPSSLTNLLSLAATALPFSPPNLNTNFIQCPFNHHHLLPPSSLFLHHLRCPSSPRPIPDLIHLLQNLTYPETLHHTTPHHSLSLDPYLPSNFFYDNCPGVVSFSQITSLNRTLTLPSILSIECTNSADSIINDNFDSEALRSRILPSEYSAIMRELESWHDFPASYSNNILRAILGLGIAKERNLITWILSNSPRYGVVIDTAMQKHIFLLCCLCFKAILREASASASSKEDEYRNSYTGRPVLKESLTWLQSLVSILYGTNGKLFVLNFVKNCIAVGASGILLFPFGEEKVATEVGNEEEIKCIVKMKIFGSQVAAAVAALHERSLLEQRIRGIWFFQQPNKYQLVSEHGYLSERAIEERKNRADYRPIIDHDILHRQKLAKQEGSREKTREELIAEQRDNKRHTKSYRGKKKKTLPIEVMRDMIEEYMEEIKLVAGAEDPVKVYEENGMFPSKPPSGHDIPVEADNSRKTNDDSAAVTITNASYNEQQSHTKFWDKTKLGDDVLSRDYEQHRHGHYRNHYYVDDKWNSGYGKYHKDCASTSPERHRSHSRSHDHRIYHKKRDYSDRKNYEDFSKTRDNRQKDTDGNHSSDSLLKNPFSDRYDPSESS